MKTAWKLAEELNHFAEEYDLYEFRDCVDDPEQSVMDTAKKIQDDETEGIQIWLQAIADDLDDETYNIETAKMLLRELKKG